jgi:glyoxylase I family protein
LRTSLNIDHVAIACRDSERMRAWYEKVLGFEVRSTKVPSRPGATAPTYLVGLPGSPTQIELMPDDRKDATPREPFTRGISHIAFAVDDLGEWESRLSSLGIQWMGLAVEAVGGGKVRSFLDPEGNMVQVVQRR